LRLSVLGGVYAVCRLEPDAALPAWIDRAWFWTVTRTADELSVVCLQAGVPADVRAERDWGIIQVEGPLDFGMTGVLASLSVPLAEAGISIFAVSTFDTDYLMVKHERLDEALRVLRKTGFETSHGS
jgi:hypothetical protein